MDAPLPIPYASLVHAVRLELETAGNPAYLTVVCDAAGAVAPASLIFASIGPSGDHAARMARAAGDGEVVLIVSRHAKGARQIFDVLAPFTLKKLHTQHEVIETAFVEHQAV